VEHFQINVVWQGIPQEQVGEEPQIDMTYHENSRTWCAFCAW